MTHLLSPSYEPLARATGVYITHPLPLPPPFLHPLIVPFQGTYLMDVFCAIAIEGRELNTVVTLLQQSGDHVRCSCTRVALDSLPQGQVQCQLYVSRCPETQDLGSFTLTDLG